MYGVKEKIAAGSKCEGKGAPEELHAGSNVGACDGKKKKKKRKKRKRPPNAVPLVYPMKSLRKARKVTSAFHRLTSDVREAERRGDDKEVARLKRELKEMGGRSAYQVGLDVCLSHSTKQLPSRY